MSLLSFEINAESACFLCVFYYCTYWFTVIDLLFKMLKSNTPLTRLASLKMKIKRINNDSLWQNFYTAVCQTDGQAGSVTHTSACIHLTEDLVYQPWWVSTGGNTFFLLSKFLTGKEKKKKKWCKQDIILITKNSGGTVFTHATQKLEKLNN